MAPDQTADKDEDAADDTTLLVHATKSAPTSPRDLHHVLANSMAKYFGKKLPAKPPYKDREITVNGTKYTQVSMAKLMYIASAHCGKNTGSLVDHGADAGIAGEDIRINNNNNNNSLKTFTI